MTAVETDSTNRFGQILLESIDDSLQVLGEEPRLAVYQYLSTIHSLDKNEIPDKLDEFAKGLRNALGGASRVIEKLILRRLFAKVGSAFKESSEYEFADRVQEAKRRYESAKQRQSDHPKLKKS